MRKSILVLPAVAAVLTLGAGAAQASTASVPHPDIVVGSVTNSNGTAGWYTNSFGDTFRQVDGTFRLNLANFANSGAVGIQLCNSVSGFTAQIGALNNGDGTWAVGYFTGFLKGDPTGTGSPCDGNTWLGTHGNILSTVGFTILGTVPAGGSVQAQIKEVHHGLLFTVADGPLANFSYFRHSFPGYFNEAAAGTAYNTTELSAPAINDLVDFSGVTATDSNHVTQGLANWNAVQVSSGITGYPPLLTTTLISPASGPVCVHHPGHWKRRHHHKWWVPGFTTCTGGGPSSFSIVAGSPTGI
jgi:hypothetical protein